MFGRETSDRFMDVAVRDPAGTVARARERRRSYGPGGPLFLQPADTVARARERLDLLSRIDARLLSAEGSVWLDYFRDFERFAIGVFMSQSAWEESREVLAKGELAKARAALAQCTPEEVIRQYVRMCSHGGISRGEQSLVISLNLRWLPYVVSTRQALGLDSVRVKFGPTQHERLAQGAGSNTFYFDASHRIWRVLGERETGARAYARDANASEPEISRSGVWVETPLTLRLAGIMGDRLAPGQYLVDVMLDRAGRGSTATTLELRGSPDGRPVTKHIDLTARGWQASIPVQVTAGQIELLVRPEGGPVSLCAVSVRLDVTAEGRIP